MQRDLNREIKLIFDKNGINIPFPQVTYSMLKEAAPAEVAAQKPEEKSEKPAKGKGKDKEQTSGEKTPPKSEAPAQPAQPEIDEEALRAFRAEQSALSKGMEDESND